MSVYIKTFKQLRKIEDEGKRLLEDTAADGLTLVQAHILFALYEEDGQHASTLARAVGREATSFTPLLDKLEKAGLIERRADKEDRRAVFIFATREARAIRHVIENVVESIEEQFSVQLISQ